MCEKKNTNKNCTNNRKYKFIIAVGQTHTKHPKFCECFVWIKTFLDVKITGLYTTICVSFTSPFHSLFSSLIKPKKIDNIKMCGWRENRDSTITTTKDKIIIFNNNNNDNTQSRAFAQHIYSIHKRRVLIFYAWNLSFFMIWFNVRPHTRTSKHNVQRIKEQFLIGKLFRFRPRNQFDNFTGH